MALKALAVIVVLVVAAGGGLAAYLFLFSQPGCGGQTVDHPGRYQAQKISFGGVTEYCLAGPSRFANGIAAAPDGSVWFGEGSVPGLAHLFPNGTVVEYPWPQADGLVFNGTYRTGIWGVALWNERVWGGSTDTNQILGLRPSDHSVHAVDIVSPNALTPGPDGSLWVTMETFDGGVIGRVFPNYTVSILPVSNYPQYIPQQVQFVNTTLAYFVAFDPQQEFDSGLFSFDPSSAKGAINATRLGAGFKLLSATGLAVEDDTVWVVQHFSSGLVLFNSTSGSWTPYPTSVDSFTSSSTTLPFFVAVDGHRVWFNEHYANKIGLIDTERKTLTEFSESDPPITDLGKIQNDLTIAASPRGLWFTSATGNYVGVVDSSYSPAFSLVVDGPKSVSVSPGAEALGSFTVLGKWTSALRVQVADSETHTSVPLKVSMTPSVSQVPAGSGPVSLSVMMNVDPSLPAGKYTLLVTVSDGLVSQSAYLELDVEA